MAAPLKHAGCTGTDMQGNYQGDYVRLDYVHSFRSLPNVQFIPDALL